MQRDRSQQHWSRSRRIVERLVVEGDLELLSPAHFGGEGEGTADLMLLRDAAAGRTLLPGASIAGALRNYWREWTSGYGTKDGNSDLFGIGRTAPDEDPGQQSLLIVEDAIGQPPQVELREGVSIDPRTRTAQEDKLFDVEVLRVGTTFPLRFELLIPGGSQAGLYRDLALALQGFERGEIGLGARKRRGYGECQVKQWRIRRYGLTKAEGLLAWLAAGQESVAWEGTEGRPAGWEDAPTVETQVTCQDKPLAKLLGVELDGVADQRDCFELVARFDLDGSLLVRSGAGQADQGPDMAHLHRTRFQTRQEDDPMREAILTGTSLAGVLRARAGRIVMTLAPDAPRAQDLINKMFGLGPEDKDERSSGQDNVKAQASRLTVREATVKGAHSLVQHRIRIDRFTGAAMDNYLFNEVPVFSTGQDNLELRLELRQPAEHEIGLLLLLLKDLWTGDLPVGGESSVGRGRLRGRYAKLTYSVAGRTAHWTIAADDGGGLNVTAEPDGVTSWDSLEAYVRALDQYLSGGEA